MFTGVTIFCKLHVFWFYKVYKIDTSAGIFGNEYAGLYFNI